MLNSYYANIQKNPFLKYTTYVPCIVMQICYLAARQNRLIDLDIYNRCCYAVSLSCKIVDLPKQGSSVSYQVKQNIPLQLTLEIRGKNIKNNNKKKDSE